MVITHPPPLQKRQILALNKPLTCICGSILEVVAHTRCKPRVSLGVTATCLNADCEYHTSPFIGEDKEDILHVVDRMKKGPPVK